MAPLRPDPPLYGAVAMDYLASGVGFPLPLPPQAKQYPPKDVTGRGGVDPTPGRVKAWCRNRQPRTNVALRLVTGVVGIDVDAYGGKQGECTLARLEQLLGSLPATVVSTSRTDGVSGIGLFQVPPDRLWTPSVRTQQEDGSVTAHIDVIQRSHRYAVVWPSVHPERRLYRWYDQDGDLLDRVPTLAEVPQLPAAWVEYLTAPTEQQFSDAARATGMGREQPRTGPSSHTREGRAELDRACWTARRAPEGDRNNVLNRVAYALGRLCVAGQVEARGAQLELLNAACDADPDLNYEGAQRTIRSGWYAGVKRGR